MSIDIFSRLHFLEPSLGFLYFGIFLQEKTPFTNALFRHLKNICDATNMSFFSNLQFLKLFLSHERRGRSGAFTFKLSSFYFHYDNFSQERKPKDQSKKLCMNFRRNISSRVFSLSSSNVMLRTVSESELRLHTLRFLKCWGIFLILIVCRAGLATFPKINIVSVSVERFDGVFVWRSVRLSYSWAVLPCCQSSVHPLLE